MKITSSGIIRNESVPRVGVVSIHSLESWALDEIDQGIDITFEEYAEDLANDESLSDAEKEEALEYAEFDSRVVLFGDAWVKVNGKYTIDRSKAFAATYNSDTGIICVDFSQDVKPCHHTSPCYVMADGSGPCGDLDTPGDAVIAYTLPSGYFRDFSKDSA